MIEKFFIEKGKDFALFCIGINYWICLFVCIISIILYATGSKKSGRIASISFIIYFLSQCLKVGLK